MPANNAPASPRRPSRKRARGEGSIRQRSDGRWEASIRLGPGKPRKYFYGRSQQEVVDKLRTVATQLASGVPVPSDKLTVADYLADWLENTVKRKNRPSTHEQYRAYAKNHIIPVLGTKSLNKLTPADVEKLMHGMLDRGLSARTAELARAILRAALSRAERHGLVTRNVAKLAESVRVERPEIVTFTLEQARVLVDQGREDRLWAAYVVGLTLGLRSGEIRGLKWEDIDFEQASLRISRSVQKVAGKLTFVETKTLKSRRTLHIPPVTMQALAEHRDRQAFERSFWGESWHEHGLMFTTQRGTPLDASSLLHCYHRLLERLGLPRQRLHDLRHACATFLLAEGVELKAIQEILGHSSFVLTANTYSHVQRRLMKDSLDKMDGLFGQQAPS